MVRLYSLVAAGLVVAMLGTLAWLIWARPAGDRFAACRTSAVAGGVGALGGPFELTDHAGRTVTDRELVTMPTILYFGYTFCPDVCPLDNARNALAVELLEERGIIAQPAFVTVDPARDTREVMAEFVSIFHPRMVGLSGSEARIREAARAFRVYYAAQPAQDDFYLIDHSTHSYLLLPGHGVVEVLPRALEAQQVAERVACFVGRL